MSTLKVDGIRSNSASSDAITLASDGTCTANITNRSNRNLMINGAMNVAQYGSSSTEDGYNTCDRFRLDFTGTNENPTQAQSDVVSSDSGDNPFAKGITRCMKITNGNQTGGAGAADASNILTIIEAQDIRNSGWNYNSTSSYITLSFYVKSSVAQNFYGYVLSADGTEQRYPYETGSLSANTWTKITKTIPGNSNIQIDNNNGEGLQINFSPFWGTNHTDSGVSLNAWAAHSSSTRTPDNTSTWYTTNDATFELTGVQLEVGSTATDFEHRSYGQELALCERYYQDSYEYWHLNAQNGESDRWIPFRTEMRGSPSVTTSPTNSVSFAAQNQTVNGFAGNGSGNDHANFAIGWTASAEI